MWIDVALLMLVVSTVFVITLYFLDRYEKEPPQLLLLAFLLGMTATFVVILLKKWLLPSPLIFPLRDSPLFRSFIEASLFEEGVKLAILLGIFYRLRDFSEPLDGIIYGAFIGAGFAYVENVLYTGGVAIPAYISKEEGAYTHALLFMTAMRSIPGHILFNAIGGYFIGVAKFRWSNKLKHKNFIYGISSAFLLHGLFDFLLMTKRHKLFFFLFLPFTFIWAGYLVFRAWKSSPYRSEEYRADLERVEGIGGPTPKGPAWAYLLIFIFPVIAYALFLLGLITILK